MKNNSALRFQKDFSCKKSAKKILFFVALLLFFCALSIAFTSSILYENIAYAADKSEEEIKKEFEGDVNDVIDGLDLDAIQNFLNSLGENEKEAVSIDDLKATLKALVSGQTQSFYQNFLNLLSKSAGRYFLSFLPSFMTIVVICLLKNMLCSLTGDFLNTSTTEVVHTVCYSAIVIVLMSGIVGIIKTLSDTIRDFPGAVDAVVVTRRNGGGFGIFAARCGAVLVCYEARWQRDFACVCCMHSFLRRRQRFKNGETRQTFKTYQVGVDLACGDSVRTFRDFFDGAGSDGRRSGQVWF